jgi:hypothetical protein
VNWLTDLNAVLGLQAEVELTPLTSCEPNSANSADIAPAVHIQKTVAAQCVPSALIPPLLSARSISEHFTSLGGHDAIAAASGDLPLAFRLWDSARLWARDHDTERQARWETQYRSALEQLEKLDLSYRESFNL